MEPTAARTLSTAADRREAVLQAAMPVMSERGINASPTAEIAKRAGISHAYLFRLFPTKTDLAVAVVKRANQRISVIVTGGTLRPLQHSLVNPLATMVLSTMNPDVAFVGCNGVHAQRGVTNVNLPEAEVKREMLGAARAVDVLVAATPDYADSSYERQLPIRRLLVDLSGYLEGEGCLRRLVPRVDRAPRMLPLPDPPEPPEPDPAEEYEPESPDYR